MFEKFDKEYLKSVALYVLSAILSLLFITYIIYHLTGSGREEVSTVNIPLINASEGITWTPICCGMRRSCIPREAGLPTIWWRTAKA